MFKVITIEREFGSGGKTIAKLLADRLGWKLWDESLTSEIANRAECDRLEVQQREERTDPLYYRLLKSFLRGSFEGSLNVHTLKMLDADSIFTLTQQIVREVAEAGNCVIVGRGSAFFLADREDSFHVFLYAPDEDKIRRLVGDGTDKAEAVRLVDTVDRERADFIKKYFDKEWPCRQRYDLMINSRCGDAAVVQTIIDVMATLQEKAVSRELR